MTGLPNNQSRRICISSFIILICFSLIALSVSALARPCQKFSQIPLELSRPDTSVKAIEGEAAHRCHTEKQKASRELKHRQILYMLDSFRPEFRETESMSALALALASHENFTACQYSIVIRSNTNAESPPIPIYLKNSSFIC